MDDAALRFRWGQVHIWKVPLSLSEETVARLNECLSLEERTRARRLRFDRDRCRFITARGALRTILGLYLNVRAGSLGFGYGNLGKPFLTDPAATRGIAFNLSHCTDMVAIGISSCRRIGIDVETTRGLSELEDIAEQHFSEDERASIRSADDKTRIRLFFHIWTRREATAKAQGLDLSSAMSDLGIPFYPPGSGVRLKQDGECPWSLHDFQLSPTCLGAVCVEGNGCDIVIRDLSPFLAPVSSGGFAST